MRDAAYLLGKIAQDQKKIEEANSFYEAVLTSHSDAKVAIAAKLGRGVCRILGAKDDPGLNDLHDATNYINGREAVKRHYKVEALTAMKAASQALWRSGGIFRGAGSDGV